MAIGYLVRPSSDQRAPEPVATANDSGLVVWHRDLALLHQQFEALSWEDYATWLAQFEQERGQQWPEGRVPASELDAVIANDRELSRRQDRLNQELEESPSLRSLLAPMQRRLYDLALALLLARTVVCRLLPTLNPASGGVSDYA